MSGCILKGSRLPGFRAVSGLLSIILVAACASGPPTMPYPAFIQADTLPDVFIAGLPGIRAKQLAGNPDTRRSSNRISLPPAWDFGTGGAPDKSLEIYVLSGEIRLGEFALTRGGYAYLPPGSMGVRMRTDGGAEILYFLDDANPASVIQTPMILGRDLLAWTPVSDDPNDLGLSVKELRADPGSGARTWLLRIEPGATRSWQTSTMVEEGYLLEGLYRHSECVNGEVITAQYTPGGYYHRPAGTVNAGPESAALESTVWLVRTLGRAEVSAADGCGGLPAG